MRLTVALKNTQPPRAPAARELLRKLLEGKAASSPAHPAPQRTEDLPADLDQRVRLVGEW